MLIVSASIFSLRVKALVACTRPADAAALWSVRCAEEPCASRFAFAPASRSTAHTPDRIPVPASGEYAVQVPDCCRRWKQQSAARPADDCGGIEVAVRW